MTTRNLAFADRDATSSEPSYSLLALTPQLLAILSNSTPSSPAFEIRGHASDSAVLVTPTETFSLRGVQNSNSLLLSQSTSGADWYRDDDDGAGLERMGSGLVIEGVLHETLEVAPAAAKTEKIEALLRGADYTGESNENDALKNKLIAPRHSLETIRSFLPASDKAITAALRANRVVSYPSHTSPSTLHLRTIPPAYLLTLLSALLASIAPPLDEDVPMTPIPKPGAKLKATKGKMKEKEVVEKTEVVVVTQELVDTLDAQDCAESVAEQIVDWFGERDEVVAGRWKVDVDAVVREVGVCLLARGGNGPQPREKFVLEWRRLVAGYARVARLDLLAGVCITPPTHPPTITFLPPSRLSSDPATRFNELFTLQPRWKESEMPLFLDDLVGGDKKKRDAMVLKFVRKVKESDGSTVWTPRNLW